MVFMAVKTTVYLNEELAEQIRRLTGARKVNQFINEALWEKLNELEAQRLEAEMKAGYLATGRERAELDADWSALDVDRWPE